MSEIIDVEIPVVISKFRYYSQRARLMLKALFAIEPVIPNLIALVLCAIVLYILDCKNLLPDIGKYHDYLYHAIQFLACYQVVISARKTLILPLVIVLGSVSAIYISHSFVNFPVSLIFLKEIVLVGVIGVAVSIFHMR